MDGGPKSRQPNILAGFGISTVQFSRTKDRVTTTKTLTAEFVDALPSKAVRCGRCGELKGNPGALAVHELVCLKKSLKPTSNILLTSDCIDL